SAVAKMGPDHGFDEIVGFDGGTHTSILHSFTVYLGRWIRPMLPDKQSGVRLSALWVGRPGCAAARAPLCCQLERAAAFLDKSLQAVGESCRRCRQGCFESLAFKECEMVAEHAGQRAVARRQACIVHGKRQLEASRP